MSYPVISLINEAFYTSGIVSRGFQTVAGDQGEVGLLKLNEILSDTAIEDNLVPYFNTGYDFFAVPSQEKYFIPGLSQLETFCFFIDTVRYQTRKQSQDKFFGEGRAENIQSLPFLWHAERCPGGTNMFIYFTPDKQYPMQVTGRFRLNNVLIGNDLASPNATANLGAALIGSSGTFLLGVTTILGTGALAATELLINGVDLVGTYASAAALANAITGGVPNVIATAVGTSISLFSSHSPLTVSTAGTVGANGVTFANFSTTAGVNSVTQQTPGNLSVGQLVINTIDLAGSYASVTAFVNHINTGIILGVRATVIDGQVYLSSVSGASINLATSGNAIAPNYVSFVNFSTMNGAVNQTYFPMMLDQYYINYLMYRLADRLCTAYNFVTPANLTAQLEMYMMNINKRSSPMDMSLGKISTLNQITSINYGQVNIGRGWYPT